MGVYPFIAVARRFSVYVFPKLDDLASSDPTD